ncbi:type V CRISPR-associated protein C2c8 [Myxosarcina sp. GI1]|uniref:type V CRISPR-associated protein C2c8 n=1 Tax=Myxosarcina sp. GI1 TaxID=1541065 RepID=UPI00056C3C15|nr:type V CRISPR-associated protein C2c8 [Myxosarcina sp. GI1]
MKTVEFKLKLNKIQRATIDSWLESLRWVWNEGLGLLLEFHHQKYYNWLEKKLVGVSANSFRADDRSVISRDREFRKCYLKFSKTNAYAASCPISVGKTPHPVCPLPVPQPRLKYDNFKGLIGYITKTNYADCPHLKGIPAKFIAGTLKHLAEAWQAYKDKKRTIAHQPKFKSKLRGDRLKSLYCIQPENITLHINHNTFACPGVSVLGKLKVLNKNLEKRWQEEIKPRTLQIVKTASEYYLQLSGNLPEETEKPSQKACGLDVGLQYIYSDDLGKQVKPPRYYRASQKRLRKFQRKLTRQQKDSKNSIKTKQAIAKLHEKTKRQRRAYNHKLSSYLVKTFGTKRQRRAYNHKLSSYLVKTFGTKRQRRAYNHKLSSYLVKTFGAIAVEDIKIANLNRRPKPKKCEDGKGWEKNNAKAKSGLNKSFADAGLGQLLTMIETKAKAHQREFIKVKANFTSQDCPKCGTRQKKSLSQRTHRCSNIGCNYVAPRDVAAAICIRAKADFLGNYLPLGGNVKPLKEVHSTSVQEESTIVELGRDALTIPSHEEKTNRKNRRKTQQCAKREVRKNNLYFNAFQTLTIPGLATNFLAEDNRAPDNSGSLGLKAKPKKKRQKNNSVAQTAPEIQLVLNFQAATG